jgi:hypothetical protein
MNTGESARAGGEAVALPWVLRSLTLPARRCFPPTLALPHKGGGKKSV